VPILTLLGVLGASIERGDDHAEALRAIRPEFDLEVERRARAAAGIPDAPREEDLYPDALPCLAAVTAAGYRVGAGGNTSVEMERFLRERCDLDFVASSAGLRVAKPDPAFFAAVARLAVAPPERIAYVGDRVDNDVLPAKAAGMIAVHIRRGPWGYVHAGRPEAAQADLRIDSLDELLPGLEALPG
jgi:FMN hydrolase / 5-amino-6-(5-phospho-D-ribitylamino)uracil phosphatase